MLKLLQNRIDAGNQLATKLKGYDCRIDTVVLALARGGVPVAYRIAVRLNLPLDILIVRKLGYPGNEEYAIGAIADNAICIFNSPALDHLAVSPAEMQAIIDKETYELKRRNQLYRKERPMPNLHGKIVIVVDDGIATGASMKCALRALEKSSPAEIVVAVPILPEQTIAEIQSLATKVVYLNAPASFSNLSTYYQDFAQVSDQEVLDLLHSIRVPG